MSEQRLLIDGREIIFQPRGDTVLEVARSAGASVSIFPPSAITGRTGTAGNLPRSASSRVEGHGGPAGLLPPRRPADGMKVSDRELRPSSRHAGPTVSLLLSQRPPRLRYLRGRWGACELQDGGPAISASKEPPFVVDREEEPPKDESAPMIVSEAGALYQLRTMCRRLHRDRRPRGPRRFGGRGGNDEPRLRRRPAHGGIELRTVRRVRPALPHGLPLHDRKKPGNMAKPGDLQTEVETTCPYCGVGCGLTLHVDRGN